jgi:selenide,water dikinase
MDRILGAKNVVLLGIGHTHAHLVKQWAMEPIANVNLIGITDHGRATYSGMLPGVLAGDYSPSQMEIDLVQLLSAAKVPWIQESLIRVDRQAKRLTFDSGRQLRYDLLSVGVGSRPDALPVQFRQGGQPALPVIGIKPMQTFLPRLEDGIREAARQVTGQTVGLAGQGQKCSRPIQIDVVGGGLGSVEVVLCLRHFLSRCGWQPEHYRLRLLSGSPNPPVGCLASTRRRILRHLADLAVTLIPNTKLVAIEGDRLRCSDGQYLPSDLVIYLGAGSAAPATRLIDLPRDERGCILTNACLQSIGDDFVWAGGDCGTIQNQPLPKAGVFAVRQGPVMWDNLKRWAQGEALQPYRPQSDFLKLINLGGKRAIGEWRGISFEGRWVWRLKDRIDSKFMNMYQTLPAKLAREMGQQAVRTQAIRSSPIRVIGETKPAMRCLGCGSKIASDSLRHVLQTISNDHADSSFNVVDSTKMADDITVIPWASSFATRDQPAHGGLAISVDAFPTPLTDPWLSGRLAVIHALSDLWASGVKPQNVLATVEIPFGARQAQEDMLQQVMGGIVSELALHQVTLVGGHTLEGPRLAIALTVLGQTKTGEVPAPKQGLQSGDRLILTKGLGTGIALAALHQGWCPSAVYERVLASMLAHNAIGLELVELFSVHAMTDVTGFGLLGHLREMTTSVGLEVRLSVPVLRKQVFPGIEGLLRRGIRSTMHENNQSFLAGVILESPLKPNELSAEGELATLLLDPQTSGGLVLAVPEAEATNCLKYLQSKLSTACAMIGSVQAIKSPDEATAGSEPRPWCRLIEEDLTPEHG